MKPQDRIKILKENIKKKEKQLKNFIKETKYKKGTHIWKEHQILLDELYILKEGLKKYRLALKDVLDELGFKNKKGVK